MDESKVTVDLTRDQAIVLAEFLLRFSDDGRLAVEHNAEQRLLWDMCCVLERQLHEMLDPQWPALLERARLGVLGAPGD
jgi:hypothetical protein